MTDTTNPRVTVSVKLNDEGKLDVHIHNEELPTEELLDALHVAKLSLAERVDQVLTETMGMTYEEYLGRTEH